MKLPGKRGPSIPCMIIKDVEILWPGRRSIRVQPWEKRMRGQKLLTDPEFFHNPFDGVKLQADVGLDAQGILPTFGNETAMRTGAPNGTAPFNGETFNFK
jgi:hypothetical protein